MKKTFLIFFISAFSFIQAQETKPFVLGETVTIHSTILSENRTLNIYVPTGYSENSTEKYSVIYLLDGAANEDFIHIAGLAQFMNMCDLLPKSIVVGIANVDRKRDFTFPTTIEKDKKDYPTTGSSEKFISFLETELKPFIEKKYRTNQSKTIIGQSLGGLLAVEILLKKPDLFTTYIITSPSLWWDNESLLDKAPTLLQFVSNKTVYIGVGKEGKIMEGDAKKLYQMLQEKTNKCKLFFQYFPEENHATILHQSVYKAFEIIYAKK